MTQNLYIVLHIYKTAGSSLRANFACNFRGKAWLPLYPNVMQLDKSIGRVCPGWEIEETQRIRDFITQHTSSKTRCIFGHMAHVGIHNLVKADVEPRYIVFLRNPVERCISLYSYLQDEFTSKNNVPNIWRAELTNAGWSVEEWFEQSQALWHHNGQVRQLLIGDYEDVFCERELTRDHLEEAKKRLRQFWYIGLTDTFDDDSHYLYGKLGFTSYHLGLMVNRTSKKKEVSPETRQFIAGCNTLDVELYRYAEELRTQYINRYARDFYFHKKKAARMRALHRTVSVGLKSAKKARGYIKLSKWSGAG